MTISPGTSGAGTPDRVVPAPGDGGRLHPLGVVTSVNSGRAMARYFLAAPGGPVAARLERVGVPEPRPEGGIRLP